MSQAQVGLLRSYPRIMGIVNVNDDSFSGDGTLDIAQALDQAATMVAEGADIIDLGAESARTNREAISENEELARLIPFIEQFSDRIKNVSPAHKDQVFLPQLSINSWRPEVIEGALQTGQVDIVNDIGGLPDDTNARLCAGYGAKLLIMHTVGAPKVPHFEQTWPDVTRSLLDFFEEKIATACEARLGRENIILDPGIDFAKQRDDNLTLYRELALLKKFKLPILLPVSRKTVIGDVLDIEDPSQRDAGTVACIVRGMRAGANIFRVHNVKAAVQATRVIGAIKP